MNGSQVASAQRITTEPAEDECLRHCREVIAGCNSAVLVTSASGTFKMCYFKGGGIETRMYGYPQRFVALGCESGNPPGDSPPKFVVAPDTRIVDGFQALEVQPVIVDGT